MDFERFRSDVKTIRAVELDFIVIGEAVIQIPEEILEAYPQVPWHLMRRYAEPFGARVLLR